MELKEVRLLHLFKSLNIGGVEKSTINYSNHLLEDFAFIGIFAKEGIYDHSNIVAQKIKLLHPPFNIELNVLSYPLHFIRVARTILHFRINVIVYHQRIFVPLIWLIRLFFRRIKIIYTAHNVFDDFKNHFITADVIIAVSEAVRKDLERCNKKDIRVLLHGVELDRTMRKSHNYTNIGYVGRFERHKGLIFLLESLKLLLERKREFRLILRGEGSFKKEIIRHISELKIENNVIIDTPKISESDVYSDIDVLTLPSLGLEGFGLVLIEAMSQGIPIVGSNIGGINEVIKDEHNGILVEPGNALQLAEAIYRILRDKEHYSSFVKNGFMTVKNKYSIKTYLSEYRQILTDLII